MMKKTLFLLLAASLLLTGAAFAGDEMLIHVSDARCAAKHNDHSQESIDCAKRCVDGGQDIVVVTEDGDVLEVSNPDSVKDHVGHQVKATVTISEDGAKAELADVEHVAP